MTSARPTFVNVGPGRCGTSWLLEVLSDHPEIGMAKVKETEYFNNNYEAGEDWYLDHFEGDWSQNGEISNNYYLDPAVPERLRSFDPSMKVIFNVRDPLTLYRSYQSFGIRRGLTADIVANPEVHIGRLMGSRYSERESRGELSAADSVSLVDSAKLTDSLEAYRAALGPENVYVFVYERLQADPEGALKDLYEFLGVDAAHRPSMTNETINPSLEPRFVAIARLATAAADILRRVGAYRILSELHKSRYLKSALFREPEQAGDGVPEPSAAVTVALDEERDRLLAAVPEVGRWWNRVPSA